MSKPIWCGAAAVLGIVLLFWVVVGWAIYACAAEKPATLTWDPNTETDLAGYRIYQSTVSGQYGAPVATVGTVTQYTFTLPELVTEQRYYFTLTAYDLAQNESAKSNEVSRLITALPPLPPIPKPGTPVLLVSARTTTSITVAYAPAPDGAGGTALVGIRYARTPILWDAAPESPCMASPCTITGLTPGTSYDVQAVAYRGTVNVNAVFGALSTVVTITTLPIDVPPAPPGGLRIASATPGMIVIVASAAECARVVTSTAGSTVAVRKRTLTCVP